MLTVAGFAFAGALLSRFNSGLTSWPGHTIKRILVAAILGAGLYWISGDYWAGLAGLSLYLGLLMPWAEHQNIGVGNPYANAAGMALVGGVMVAILPAYGLTLAGYRHAWVMPLVCALVGPAYYAAWKWLVDVRLGGFIDGFNAIGELSRGFLVCGSAAWVVLH